MKVGCAEGWAWGQCFPWAAARPEGSDLNNSCDESPVGGGQRGGDGTRWTLAAAGQLARRSPCDNRHVGIYKALGMSRL